MSPTIFRADGFRFYFFSREEPRMHVHAQSADGEAKFWIEPAIELAVSYNLRDKDLSKIRRLIEEHEDDIRAAWNRSAEVLGITPNGLWLLLDDTEHFLAFEHFPWFRDAPVRAVLHVERPQPHHLYWPQLDVDLHVESITHPEKYPLVSRPSA